MPLIELADKVGVTYKTISTKIKKLQHDGVITKFTASINLDALEYDVYLVTFDVKNLSATEQKSLRSYLREEKNVRTAFLSGAKPKVFVYLAIKDSTELQDFLQEINNKFSGKIIDTEYFISSRQHKYELFPKEVLE